MRAIFTSLVVLGLFTNVANASVAIPGSASGDKLTEKSIFDQIRDTAPRAPFDRINATAPRSIFDDLRATAPRSDGVFGTLQRTSP